MLLGFKYRKLGGCGVVAEADCGWTPPLPLSPLPPHKNASTATEGIRARERRAEGLRISQVRMIRTILPVGMLIQINSVQPTLAASYGHSSASAEEHKRKLEGCQQYLSGGSMSDLFHGYLYYFPRVQVVQK